MPFLEQLLTFVRLVDLLDVALTALLLYYLLAWLTQRASRSALLALFLVGGVYLATQVLRMYLTSALFQAGFVVIAVGLVLVFQEDIRRAFERLAAWGRPRRPGAANLVEVLVESVWELTRRKWGGLIVLPGREALDRHLQGGVPLDGLVSTPVLTSIFDPHSGGHDGAVILDDGRIRRFGVHLPLSSSLPEGAGGTRHAAALGLAERTDALVIVVSEERGAISLAEGASLETVKRGELRRRLDQFFGRLQAGARKEGGRPWLKQLGLKAAAASLAAVLWMLFAFPAEILQRSYVVPIEFRNLPADWKLDDPLPLEARVTFSGPGRSFERLDPGSLVLSVDASGVSHGLQYVELDQQTLRGRTGGLRVVRIDPRVTPVRAVHVEPVHLPVEVQLAGELPEGLRLVRAVPQPERVRVLVSRDRRGTIAQIETAPISLAEITQTTTIRVPLVLPEGAYLPGTDPVVVQVTLHVAAAGFS